VRFVGFVTITRSTTTADAVDRADRIVELLDPLLETIDPSPGVRLVGVSGSNLGPPLEQLSFDDLGGAADWDSATGAVDQIRDRFGDDAIGPASSLSGGRLRRVRRGAQQWGPGSEPSPTAEDSG
jgi:DNA polymerase-4